VLVANDALASDCVQTMIMETAVPCSVRLVVDTVDNVADMLTDADKDETRRMVIVDNPLDALRLKKAGVDFDVLNLGNLRSTKITKTLSNSVLVCEDLLDVLCDLLDEGVKISIQAVPFEKAVDFCDVCSCLTSTETSH
jgi:mannose/fructose/N-acetylgalactosamine-specific phosphotransferase system component IIB